MRKQNIRNANVYRCRIKVIIDSAITLLLLVAFILTSVFSVPDHSIIYPILLVCDVIFGIYIIYTYLFSKLFPLSINSQV
jgi:hypothetical protein